MFIKDLITTEPGANTIAWVNVFTSIHLLPSSCKTIPLLATATESESSPFVLAGVLLSLVVIYLASTIGAELCVRLKMPPVLGQLLGGLVVGISAFHLLVFPDSGGDSSNWRLASV